MARLQYPFAPNGVAPDLVPEQAPPDLWTRGSNVYARSGMERAGGIVAAYGSPLFQPRWLLNTKSTVADSFWVYGADTGIGGTDGTHVDLTPASGFVANAEANCWTGGNLNGLPVVCNGTAPFWWDQNTANNFVQVPGWQASYRARSVRPYQFHLIAMAVDPATGQYNEDLVHWSTSAAPGAVPSTWVPAPNNEAGSVQLSSRSGEILDGFAMRGSFIIYKGGSCYSMQYVGGAQVMNVKLLFSDVGTLTRNCVGEIDGLHVVLSDGDIILHDGQIARSIADSYIRETFLDVIESTAIFRCFVLSWTPPGEVWIAFPEGGSDLPTKAAVWDRQRERWGVRDLALIRPTHIAQGVVPIDQGDRSWANNPQAWQDTPRAWGAGGPRSSRYSLLAAGFEETAATLFAAVPGLFALDQTVDTLGQITRGRLGREALDFDQPDTVKIVRRVWIEWKGPVGSLLGVQIAGTMNAGDSPTYGDIAYVQIGGRMDAPLFASGRYISVQLTDASLTPLASWKVAGVTFEYEVKGRA